jgi:hypothetical protein
MRESSAECRRRAFIGSFWIPLVLLSLPQPSGKVAGQSAAGTMGTSCRRLFTEREEENLVECDFPATQGAWYYQSDHRAFIKQALDHGPRGERAHQVLVGTETDEGATSVCTGLLFFDVRALLLAAVRLSDPDGAAELGGKSVRVNTTAASVSCVFDGNEAQKHDAGFELRTVDFDWSLVTEDDELEGRIPFPLPVCASKCVACAMLPWRFTFFVSAALSNSAHSSSGASVPVLGELNRAGATLDRW